jgi:SAM-dependent methyltransferase
MVLHSGDRPSDWLVRHAELLSPGIEVLDLAAGSGRHARWLAGRGCRVTAIDRSPEALASLSRIEGVRVFEADVEAGPWPVTPASLDAVVVTNYLHRPLYGAIAASLRPGGVLVYETFMIGNERYGRPSNPAFLLREGELLEAFAGLRVVAFEQGLIEGASPRVVQRLLARAAPGELQLPAQGVLQIH